MLVLLFVQAKSGPSQLGWIANLVIDVTGPAKVWQEELATEH